MLIRKEGIVRRFALAPYEVAFGFVSIWSGLAGLFNWTLQATAFNMGLPTWLSTLSNLLYAVSGLAIIGGVIHHLREVEVFGLMVLGSSISIRILVLLWVLDTSAIVTIVPLVMLLLATVLRLWVLLSGYAVILAEKTRKDDPADAIISQVH